MPLFIVIHVIYINIKIAVSLITPGHPRTPKTLQDNIICMFNILYERVDDGLVLVYWCIN